MRILYIGDPLGIHDPKWISYFSTTGHVEAHLITYPKEHSRITEADRTWLINGMNIRLHEPLQYYSVLKPHQTYASVQQLRKIIKTHKIDLVHALFAAPSALWALHLDVPFVITTRGSDVLRVIPELTSTEGWHANADCILYTRFNKAFHKAAAITSTSHRQLEMVWQMFGTTHMSLVRTGVDVTTIEQADMAQLPESLRAGPFIFLPRFTEPIYNTMLQAKALSAIPASARKDHFIAMVGGNMPDYEREVAAVMESAGWQVKMLRNLSQPQMWAAFRAAKMSIMTPLSDGTPNSALEGMAARCPNILGAFNYDTDLFGPDFCLRMQGWEPAELTTLIQQALGTNLQSMTDRAYNNVLERGNRKVEMEKLRLIYDRAAGSR